MNLLFTPTTSISSTHKEFTLENSEKFLKSSLKTFSNSLIDILANIENFSNELNKFKNEMKCILIHERDENEIFTFDKTHKIKVILPKDKLIYKILKSEFYIKETQFHKHKVSLHKPAFDLKIGFDSTSENFYINLVLVCQDFTIHERYLDKENLKKLSRNELVEKDKEILKIFSKIFEELDMNEIVFKKILQSDYSGFKSIFDFFKLNEFLILSNKIFPKLEENFSPSEIYFSFRNLEKNRNNINNINDDSPFIDLKESQNEFEVESNNFHLPENYKNEEKNNLHKENIIIKKVQNVKSIPNNINNNNSNPHVVKFSTNNITFRKINYNAFNQIDKKFNYDQNSSISISQEEKIKTKIKVDKEIEDILK